MTAKVYSLGAVRRGHPKEGLPSGRREVAKHFNLSLTAFLLSLWFIFLVNRPLLPLVIPWLDWWFVVSDRNAGLV
jgi:hypothetical protein